MCGSYTRAFGLIMRKLGINSRYIIGTAGGDQHAWNAVEIEGAHYYIDLTWDDVDGEPCDQTYHYFCLSEADILKTHTIDREFGSVTADSSKYNYYTQEGAYLYDYSLDAASRIISSQSDRDMISIRFFSEIEMNRAYNDLIASGGIFKIKGMETLKTYQYMLNDDFYILTIVLH